MTVLKVVKSGGILTMLLKMVVMAQPQREQSALSERTQGKRLFPEASKETTHLAVPQLRGVSFRVCEGQR